LIVDEDARATVLGSVQLDVVSRGKLEIYGTVEGLLETAGCGDSFLNVGARVLRGFRGQVIIACPSCSQRLRVPTHQGDLSLRCSKCANCWSWSTTQYNVRCHTQHTRFGDGQSADWVRNSLNSFFDQMGVAPAERNRAVDEVVNAWDRTSKPNADSVPIYRDDIPEVIPVGPEEQVLGICQACGRKSRTVHVTFRQHIGAVVVMFQRKIDGNLCQECMGKFFREYTTTTLFAGWWGLISFFMTPFCLCSNISEYFRARRVFETPDETRAGAEERKKSTSQ
jgi:hypothetical protein